MVNYEADIEKEAKEFFQDTFEEQTKQAIKDGSDWDYNEIEDLDSYWHGTIVDRAYSAEDAVFILDNCENEETDSGLWESLGWREQLSARAAYSFGHDVWFKCEEIYKEMKADYETQIDELDEDAKDYDKKAEVLLNEIFEEYTSTKLEPVTKGSQDEKYLIERWISLNERAGMRGGYPVGSSYIDARCGTGHGQPDAKDYVDFDHEFAQQVPHLSGKNRSAVKEYYEKTFTPS